MTTQKEPVLYFAGGGAAVVQAIFVVLADVFQIKFTLEAQAAMTVIAMALIAWYTRSHTRSIATLAEEALNRAKVAKGIGVALLAVGLSLGLQGCAPLPPGLTAPAVRAFYGTQVIHDLDRIRDVAVAAHQTTPPVLTAEESLAIVKWHRVAIETVHAAPAGWRLELTTGLDRALEQLSPRANQVVGPYVRVIRAVLKEIP